ncbi:MAG: glycoside hydrolase family 32 protein [Opitutaceae bacterium]|nr:glycoside hydrolase family 32 protein [Opitutaceae bacterium]
MHDPLYIKPPLGALLLLCTAGLQGAGDVIIADFEGKDFAGWTVAGDAFGRGPVNAEMPGQGPPSGFLGKGWANSFHGGSAATGRLRSPAFTIRGHYINFLAGGARNPGKTGIRLLVDGRVARETTGPNDATMKIQRLDWASWDVSALAGRGGVVEIFDDAAAGPAHILADHVVMSDRDYAKERVERAITVTGEWLHVPVSLGARQALLRLHDGDELLREFEAGLAGDRPDFWTFEHIGPFRGKTLRLEADWLPDGRRGLDVLAQSDEIPGAAGMYGEKYRPQFHFSARRGRILDPNGLVYYDGEYHLFFQHFPYALNRTAIRNWGHAVSRDMIHWQELPDAIYTDGLGTVYSGCAVVDHNDTSGLRTGAEKVIACIYTSASGGNPSSRGRLTSQSMAYSTDRGRTWTKYPGNPVVPNMHGGNRDPKVIWHEPAKRWIMALFLKNDGTYLLLESRNLLSWEKLSEIRLPGVIENPDFFELPVDGDRGNRRWVFSANGNYYTGRFDGATFAPEGGLRSTPWDGTYAEQTFNDMEDPDRRVQLAYIQGGRFPGMPFRTQMTVPRELTLKSSPGGIVLCAEPIAAMEQLRGKKHAWPDKTLPPGGVLELRGPRGGIFDIAARIQAGAAWTLRAGNIDIYWDPAAGEMTVHGRKMPVAAEGRAFVALRVLVDRTSVEVFANEGRAFMCVDVLPDMTDGFRLDASKEAPVRLDSMEIYEMTGIHASPPFSTGQ